MVKIRMVRTRKITQMAIPETVRDVKTASFMAAPQRWTID